MICERTRTSWTGPWSRCPCLPLRFGTVMATKDAVAGKLLARGLSGGVRGRAEGSRGPRAVCGERTVRRADGAGRGTGGDTGSDQAGEADPGQRPQRHPAGADPAWVSSSATRSCAKRAADTQALGEVVAPHCVASVVREPTHELDAVHCGAAKKARARHVPERKQPKAVTVTQGQYAERYADLQVTDLQVAGPEVPPTSQADCADRRDRISGGRHADGSCGWPPNPP